MSKWLEYAVFGFFGCIAAAIVFIKAGQGGKQQTGGQQTAAIISAGGSALSQIASALEGGK